MQLTCAAGFLIYSTSQIFHEQNKISGEFRRVLKWKLALNTVLREVVTYVFLQ